MAGIWVLEAFPVDVVEDVGEEFPGAVFVAVLVPLDESMLEEAVAASCRVEKGVGSDVCFVAVTLLTPIAERYVWFAFAMLTPEFGDVKLLMHTFIWPDVVVQLSPATALQQKTVPPLLQTTWPTVLSLQF